MLKIQIMSHIQRSLDIYGFLCLVITNIDYQRPKQRGGIVGTYSNGVKMALKVGLTPMETIGVGWY